MLDFFHFFKKASWVNTYAHFEQTEDLKWQDVLLQKRCWPGIFYGTGEEFFWTPDSLVFPKGDNEMSDSSPPPPAAPSASPDLSTVTEPSAPAASLIPLVPLMPLASPPSLVMSSSPDFLIPSTSAKAAASTNVGKDLSDFFQTQYHDILHGIGGKGKMDMITKKEVDYDADDDLDGDDGFFLSLIEAVEEENQGGGSFKTEAAGSISSGDTLIVTGEPEPMDVDDENASDAPRLTEAAAELVVSFE